MNISYSSKEIIYLMIIIIAVSYVLRDFVTILLFAIVIVLLLYIVYRGLSVVQGVRK